ncbi:MAG TPA: 2OG-Fe(II) oxygenase [Oscillatoriales cyanobacterium M59_W2019_021]|nr:MAG: 2OG-Fe(II) oxygenase [Cyanobacteria bacterium J055]HIK30437.1 2OG-Fe(II) oxygenase [Oscillatoriales cyanobacterium M4454_W2019_049]HIK51078.1 2OG-Fe(II) oxygenase [Oscillatoriales cyanobacterium M59_W2019_021]
MSNLHLLQNLGLYIEPNFLPADFCSKLLDLGQLAQAKPALVWTPGINQNLDLSEDNHQRKTEQIEFDDAIFIKLRQYFHAVKPKLEHHFHLQLKSFQNPLFYRYKIGSFFGAHRDRCDREDAPDFLRDRQVSTVIFLNQQQEESHRDLIDSAYCGGSLAFYGLIDDPRWQNFGFPVPSQPGMLVAFPSDRLHEVKKVTAGERYTIVSWFV